MLGQAVDLGDLVVAGGMIGDDVVLRRERIARHIARCGNCAGQVLNGTRIPCKSND